MAVLKGNGSILEAFGGLLKDTAAGKAFKWMGVVTSGVDELGLAMAKDVATRSALIPGAGEAAKVNDRSSSMRLLASSSRLPARCLHSRAVLSQSVANEPANYSSMGAGWALVPWHRAHSTG